MLIVNNEIKEPDSKNSLAKFSTK